VRDQQILLRREVVVEGARRHAGGAHDVGDAHAAEVAAAQLGARRLEQTAALLLGRDRRPPAPARRVAGGGLATRLVHGCWSTARKCPGDRPRAPRTDAPVPECWRPLPPRGTLPSLAAPPA